VFFDRRATGVSRSCAPAAKVSDIVVLGGGADDGVMPQTREAIDHRQGGTRADHRGDQQIDSQRPAERVKRELTDLD